MSNLRIPKIEVHKFTFPMIDVGKDYNSFNFNYEKVACLKVRPASGYLVPSVRSFSL